MGRAVGSGQSAVCREDGAAHGSPCSAPAAAGSTVGRTITFPHLVKGGPGGGVPAEPGTTPTEGRGLVSAEPSATPGGVRGSPDPAPGSTEGLPLPSAVASPDAPAPSAAVRGSPDPAPGPTEGLPFPSAVAFPAAPGPSPSTPLLALTNPINCSSHPSVTITSLLSSTRYSPRAALSPWLTAAGNPRFVALVMTVTGTLAMSLTPARYSGVPSVDPLSTTISSHGRRVWLLSAARHCRVNSSWPARDDDGSQFARRGRALAHGRDSLSRRSDRKFPWMNTDSQGSFSNRLLAERHSRLSLRERRFLYHVKTDISRSERVL